MTATILFTVIAVWVLISAAILLSICMLSSRLSHAEEERDRPIAVDMRALESSRRGGRPTQPRADVVESATR